MQLNGPRIIATFEEERLISLKNLSNAPIVEILEGNVAVMFAEEIIEKANIDYGTYGKGTQLSSPNTLV